MGHVEVEHGIVLVSSRAVLACMLLAVVKLVRIAGRWECSSRAAAAYCSLWHEC